MKKFPGIRKKFGKLLNPPAQTDIIGFIEEFTHQEIKGWVFSRSAAELNLTLQTEDGIDHALIPSWHTRSDVATQYGAAYLLSGFSIMLPHSISNHLMYSQNSTASIIVKASGTRLKFLAPPPEPIRNIKKSEFDMLSNKNIASTTIQDVYHVSPTQARAEGMVITDDSDLPLIYVNDFWAFTIYGTIVDKETNGPIQIILNDEVQLWPIHFEDLGSFYNIASGGSNNISIFEIEVPGYLWESMDSEELTIELSIANSSERIPVSFSTDTCSQWLNAIPSDANTDSRIRASLSAIEHIHYSQHMRELLTERALDYYKNFAQTMQLGNFIGGKLGDNNALEAEDFTLDIDTRLLWSAQKKLNEEISTSSDNIFEKMVSCIQQNNLNTQVKLRLIQSTIPTLAANDELPKLKQLMDFKEFHILENSNSPWDLSLAAATLAADKQTSRATSALWKLSENINSGGWVSTQCIFFCISETINQELNGHVSQDAAEKLYYAFIGILGAYRHNWFSRLHDKMLHKSIALMLQHKHVMTDYLQTDTIAAALRNYGLSADFWQILEQGNIDTSHSLLNRGHHYWQCIKQFFDNTSNDLSVVVEAITFFKSFGNNEADQFLREVAILTISQGDNGNIKNVASQLATLNMMDLVRVLAHPSLESEPLTKDILSLYNSEILDTLRFDAEYGKSPTFQAQRLASQSALSGSVSFSQLNSLNNWNGMFLSADLLVSHLIKNPHHINANLLKLDDYFNQAIAESKSDFYLPAPICAALANIKHIKSNSLITAWTKNILSIIDNKFGTLHNTINVPQKTALQLNAGWPGDTLVVIYSCRAYLDTRIDAIRKTWINQLKARNIPYLILVGDGKDTIEDGDILALDVSDTYEDLPAKTLKMFDWVYHNTNAQYVLKIDDDCFLDVDSFFNNLSYRKHHYYGRILHRNVGGMDRTWHHSKSKTLRAQKTLDKSPEPSTYCDGGGGYTLSRIAMHALLQNMKTAKGKRLIASSFMEDKLVGDLLNMNHFMPSNEDYACYQRRRSFGKALPVGIWENLFFPSKSTPTVVTHLDTELHQDIVQSRLNSEMFWPKKIWPSCQTPTLKYNFNQMELLTDITKTNALLENPLFVVAAMRNEMIILPHFLDHYRNMGVQAFIISDNFSDDGTREYLHQQPDVILYSADTEYKHSNFGVSWQQAILSNHCINKWALIADADEFLVFPETSCNDLHQYVLQVEIDGADCIRTEMVDMYPFNDLEDADFTVNAPFEVANWHDKTPLLNWHLGSGHFSNRISAVSALRHRLDQNAEPNAFTSQKYALFKYKPWIRLSQGIHDITGVNVHQTPAWFAHFKYHAGFKQKIAEEIKRKQHYNGAQEYRRYATMLAEISGSFGDPDVSVNFGK